MKSIALNLIKTMIFKELNVKTGVVNEGRYSLFKN